MRLLRAAQKAIMMLEKKIEMLENELTSYRGGQKPIAIKDTKGSKRRLTTGNIGRTLKGSGNKTNGMPGNLGALKTRNVKTIAILQMTQRKKKLLDLRRLRQRWRNFVMKYWLLRSS